MNVIGFNFTKILAEKLDTFSTQLLSINTNIEVLDLQKEKVEIIKDLEAYKISYLFKILYNNRQSEKKEKTDKTAEISFEGAVVVTSDKEESKEIQKFWKKKELPSQLKVQLFNYLLKKCSIKAAFFEEEVSLPPHLPIPQLNPIKKDEK